MPRSDESQPSIGDILRKQRVEVLGKGLREAAGLLQIAPAHLTDIEKGRRNPSEELLLRITKLYRIDEAKLRSGWSRPETIVAEIASQSPTTAAKVPQFLRQARNLTPEQWDKLINQAKKLATEGGKEQSP
jgi:transcriptional regulator with XRE-family HTH domain